MTGVQDGTQSRAHSRRLHRLPTRKQAQQSGFANRFNDEMLLVAANNDHVAGPM